MATIHNFIVALNDNALKSVKKLCLDKNGKFTFSNLPEPSGDSWTAEPDGPVMDEDNYAVQAVANAFSGRAMLFTVTKEEFSELQSFMNAFAAECDGSCLWIWEFEGCGGGQQLKLKNGYWKLEEDWGPAKIKSMNVSMDVDSEDEPLECELDVLVYKTAASPLQAADGLWFVEDIADRYANPLIAIGRYAQDSDGLITNLRKLKTTLRFIVKNNSWGPDLRDELDELDEFYSEEAIEKITELLDELYEEME